MRIVVVIVTLFWAPNLFGQSPFLDANAEKIETFLNENFRDSNSGMVIGLIDERGMRVFAAGVLDNGTNKQVDADTLFELGSVTKVFCCLLMLDSAGRQELKIDDPVRKHLPNNVRVPDWNGQPITLLNLAAHDSGLPWFPARFGKNRPLQQIKADSNAYTVAKLYEDLKTFQLDRQPGTAFGYSNMGYALLGHAIERASGSSFDTLVRKRIGQQLGMKNTRVTLTAQQKTNRALGHWADGTQSEHVNFQAMIPAGLLYSNANDLLNFLAALLSLRDTPLKPHFQRMQEKPFYQTNSHVFGNTCLAWKDSGVYQPSGSQLWGHGGGGLGNLAFIGFDGKKRRGVVILTNQLRIFPDPIGWTLLQEMPFTPGNLSSAVRQVVGLGVALGKDQSTGELRITKVFPDSPAGKAGLAKGTIVLKINQIAVKEKSLQDCLQLTAGKAETKVSLDLRDTSGKEASISLTRSLFLTSS